MHMNASPLANIDSLWIEYTRFTPYILQEVKTGHIALSESGLVFNKSVIQGM